MFPRERFIWVRTKSGRRFRFDITEYRVFADTTPAQVDAIAARVVADKYRFCKWDRDHPNINVQREMLQAVTALLLHLVEGLKQRQARSETDPTVFDLEKFVSEHALSETHSLRPTRRGRSVSGRTRVVWGVLSNSGQLIATFAYPDQQKARDLAEKLTQEKHVTHYVQPVKQRAQDDDRG